LEIFIILTALAAAADDPSASRPAADPDPIVCKRDRNSEVGTHMKPKPVCMKKSDWDFVERQTQTELQSLHERSAFDPGKADGHRPQ
jgi:hypothetical protein